MGRVVQRVAPANLKEAAPRVQQRVVALRVAQRVVYFRRAPFMADLSLLVPFLYLLFCNFVPPYRNGLPNLQSPKKSILSYQIPVFSRRKGKYVMDLFDESTGCHPRHLSKS